MNDIRCHRGIQNVTKVDFNIEFQNDSCGISCLTDKLKKEKLNDEQLGLQNWVLVVMLR